MSKWKREIAFGLALGTLALGVGCGKLFGPKDSGTLHLAIWSDYISDEIVEKFSKETGIQVTVTTYDDNETLEHQLQTTASGYDLVVPSDYMVSRLAKQQLLQPLDKTKLQGLENLDPSFLNQKFDPGNVHSLPFVWGTTGIGYNKEKLGEVDSWSVLFDPKNAGRISMLEDTREVIAATLRSLGKSVNDTTDASLAAVTTKLTEQKKLVKTYTSLDYAAMLAAGDVDLAHGYSGALAKVTKDSNGKLAYVVPKEGGSIWMDNICLTAAAANTENAYRFLSYILRPEVNASIVNFSCYAGANAKARALIEPDLINNPATFAPKEVRDRCEFMNDLGPAAEKFDAVWEKIKSP